MESIGKTYQHVTFQCDYTIIVDYDSGRTQVGTFVFVSKIIYSWVKDKFGGINPPGMLCDFRKDNHSIAVNIMYSKRDICFRLETSHPDNTVAKRIWITQVDMVQDGKNLRIAIKNYYTSDNREYDSEDSVSSSIPKFVREIASRVRLVDASCGINKLSVVSSIEDINKLSEFISSKERFMPVIIVSENTTLHDMERCMMTNNGYLVDADVLTKELSFFSHIVLLPANFQFDWTEKMGMRWSVYNGAVRTFYPSFDPEDNMFKHPFIPTDTILMMHYVDNDGNEYTDIKAFRYRLVQRIKRWVLDSRIQWRDRGHLFYSKAYRDRIKSDRNKGIELEEFFGEYAKEIDKENEEYKELVQDLDDELEKKNNEILKMRSIEVINQHQIYQLKKTIEELKGVEAKERPQKYDDMADWIENEYAGRIELAQKAKRSLKSACYEDIELVCNCIDMLGGLYYDMHMGFGPSWDDYNKRQAELYVKDEPAISKTSAGELGDEYDVIYNGRKCRLEQHIVKGNDRDPRYCLRIYFFWDDETNRVVIGSLPGHLQNRLS